MTWRIMTSFAFSLPDRPGELSRVSALLRASAVHLHALWGYTDGEDEPRVSCVPDNPDAFRLFAATNGLQCEEGRTLYRVGEDATGAMVDTFMRIADAGINVEAVESMAVNGQYGCFLWCEDADFDRLSDLLEDAD